MAMIQSNYVMKKLLVAFLLPVAALTMECRHPAATLYRSEIQYTPGPSQEARVCCASTVPEYVPEYVPPSCTGACIISADGWPWKTRSLW